MNKYPLPDFNSPLQIQSIELEHGNNNNPKKLARSVLISFVNAYKHKYTLLTWPNDSFLDLYVDCWKDGLFVCLDADFTNDHVFEVETNHVDNVRLVRILDDDEKKEWQKERAAIIRNLMNFKPKKDVKKSFCYDSSYKYADKLPILESEDEE